MLRNLTKTRVSLRITPSNKGFFLRGLATPTPQVTPIPTSSSPSPPKSTAAAAQRVEALTDSNKLEKTLKKFWKKVDLHATETHFEIQLDSKPLKTPLGNKLAIPKERHFLAHLIQHEWSALATSTIKTHSMPLTSLASRAVDLEAAATSGNSDDIVKVGKREDIIDMLLRYLDTDTLLVFSPQHEYEGGLRADQELKYRPIIKEIEEMLDAELTFLDSDKDGLRGNYQPPETREKARAWLMNLNYWDLVAVEKVTLHAKSLICAILVVRAKSQAGDGVTARSLEEIAEAATLEVIHQTKRWGEVEDTHDVDYQDIRRQINSAGIVAYTERK